MKRILLDQNVPRRLARTLTAHQVETAHRLGWSTLTNGDLIKAAEAARFDLIITADQNLEYQQNLANRRVALLVLDTNRWPVLERNLDVIAAAVDGVTMGSFWKLTCF